LHDVTNGAKVVEVNGDTVGQCLNRLVEQLPDIEPELFDKKGELRGYIGIYINGESAHPGELGKPVKDGDELSIILVIAGG